MLRNLEKEMEFLLVKDLAIQVVPNFEQLLFFKIKFEVSDWSGVVFLGWILKLYKHKLKKVEGLEDKQLCLSAQQEKGVLTLSRIALQKGYLYKVE